MANSERLLRLLKLIALVDRRSGAAMDELVEHSGVSERTVFRDVEALNEAGLPIYFDEQRRRYFFSERVFLKPLTFSVDEAAALLRAIDTLNVEGAPYGSDLLLARDKVLASLPEIYRAEAGRNADAVEVEIRNRSPVRQELFKILEKAVRSCNRIEMEYESLTGSERENRLADPYALTLRDGRWYMVAFCRKHNEIRVFRVDRVLAAHGNGEKFTVPPEFSLEDYFSGCLSVVRGELVQVQLKFSPQAARWVREERYHEQQHVEILADGSLILEAPFRDNWELHSMITGFGSNVEVLAPRELRARIAAELEKSAMLYK